MKKLAWTLVVLLFVVFHWLYLTNQIVPLLWLTILSVGPIWLLTAIGGTVEISALVKSFGQKEEGE